MENIFVEFLPPWIETSLQPAFYDKESGTVLQQTSRMYAKVNEVVATVNHQNEVINDFIEQFNALHDYVYDYFENLNVQSEINNKLDVMAENGDFNLIIAQYTEPYINAINSNYEQLVDSIENTVEQQNAKIDSVSNGTPLVANSTSGMTDTTKIYVNTADGNWYYYNGSSWTIGGSYQTTGVGTGAVDFINLAPNLSESLEILTLNTSAQFNWEQGIIQANGKPGTDTSHAYWNVTIRTADFISLEDNRYLSYYKGASYYLFMWFYDDNNNLVGSRYDGGNIMEAKTECLDLKTLYPNATKFKCSFRQGTSIAPTLVPSDYTPSMIYIVLAGKEVVLPPITIPDEYIHSTPDNLISLPSLGFGNGSYASGQCLVKDYLVSFGVSNDEHTDYKEMHIFKINKTQKTYEQLRTVTHNFGHVNSVDYNERTDCLIFGNGSGVYGREGEFAIYKNFSEFIEDDTQTTLEYSDCMVYDCSDVPFKNEEKWNVIWFDADRELNDLALLVTNDLEKFRILQLAKGNKEFRYGTKQSVGSTEFNGTFQVNETFEFDPSDTTDHVLQDMDYQSGKLYCGVSHNYPNYWVFTFDRINNTLHREIVPIYAYNTDGEPTDKGASAICCNDEYVFLNTGLIIVKPRI